MSKLYIEKCVRCGGEVIEKEVTEVLNDDMYQVSRLKKNSTNEGLTVRDETLSLRGFSNGILTKQSGC